MCMDRDYIAGFLVKHLSYKRTLYVPRNFAVCTYPHEHEARIITKIHLIEHADETFFGAGFAYMPFFGPFSEVIPIAIPSERIEDFSYFQWHNEPSAAEEIAHGVYRSIEAHLPDLFEDW